jgi:hypothetical protein
MTMQIVMVGFDGIVLASDKRCVNNEKNVRHTSDASKIKIHAEKGVAIACARSMEVSSRVADDILMKFSDLDWELVELKSIPIAQKALDEVKYERRDFQCLIVKAYPARTAFHLSSGVFANQNFPTCVRISNCQIAGDHLNSAVFWPERYYWRSSLRETRQLVPLAAHTICSAKKLNESHIDGLEVVVCDAKGIRLLPDEFILRLKKNSEKWEQEMGQQFSNFPRIEG